MLNSQSNFDSINFRDFLSLIKKRKHIFIVTFVLLFSSLYWWKTAYFPTFRLQQGILMRDGSGQIVEPDYLFNLRKHFFQSDWIVAKINSRIPDSTLDHKTLQKRLLTKVIPFAGPSPKHHQLERGYILALIVDSDSADLGKLVLSHWIAVLKEELLRIDDEVGLDFKFSVATEPVLIRSRFTEKLEATGVSFALAFLLSIFTVVSFEIFAKHSGRSQNLNS